MQVETEDVHVTKLVDFIAKIPEHFTLHFFQIFYDFLRIFEVRKIKT